MSGREELDGSIRQYEQLIESSSDLFSIIDANHRYTFCSQAYAALYERCPDDVVGRHVGELVGADFFETHRRPYIDRCIAGEPQRIEVDRSYEHLGVRRLLIRSYPIPSPDGRTVRAASVLTDITDLRDAEREMRVSRDHLAQALQTRQQLINALPAHIALLGPDGTIIEVSGQWRHFGIENAYGDPDMGVGQNYLSICEGATGEFSEGAAEAGCGLAAVLAGVRETFSIEYPCHSPDEARWFRMMANRLGDCAGAGVVVMHVDITERKLAEQELNRLAYRDPLTGLRSRNGFVQALGDRLWQRGWQPNAMVIMFDICRHRDINDSYGYTVGDQLLQAMGERMGDVAGEDALVGRVGGDEFVIFVPESDETTPSQQRDRIAQAFETPFAVDDLRIEASARFGYTLLGDERRTNEKLIREVELALFDSAGGEDGDDWRAYSTAIDHDIRQRLAITRELREALAEDQFQLHFQPKVRLKNGEVVASEALLR